MTNSRTPPQLPHHRLVAYQVAVELLLIIKVANIRDAKLRDEALRAAKSTVLNIAEGAGRFTRPDKNRAFTIARGEGLEAFAALETAALVGDAEREDVARCLPVAQRLYALLTGLITYLPAPAPAPAPSPPRSGR
jgi:four helix bundle protein